MDHSLRLLHVLQLQTSVMSVPVLKPWHEGVHPNHRRLSSPSLTDSAEVYDKPAVVFAPVPVWSVLHWLSLRQLPARLFCCFFWNAPVLSPGYHRIRSRIMFRTHLVFLSGSGCLYRFKMQCIVKWNLFLYIHCRFCSVNDKMIFKGIRQIF